MPKFNIVLSNGEDTRNIIYDSDISEIIDTDGSKIIPPPKSYDYGFDRKITISLGFSCNMKCSYCLQSKTKKSQFDIGKVKELLDKLNTEDLSRTRIEFWGGEPTLYWREIEYIVNNIKNKPAGGYLMITNGTGLTKDRAKWLISNSFQIAVSHDAQGQSIRGLEPLKMEPVREAVEWLIRHHNTKVSINSVLTKDNLNTKDRKDYFRKLLGLTTQHINTSGEGPAYNTDVELIDLETLHDNIYNDIVGGEGLEYGFYKNTIDMFINTIAKRSKLENITTKCGIERNDRYKILSLDGKTLSCHNYDHSFEIQKLSDSDQCKKCLVAHLCKSSCPAIPKDSEMFQKNCEVMFQTYTALFRVAVMLMTDGSWQVMGFTEIVNGE